VSGDPLGGIDFLRRLAAWSEIQNETMWDGPWTLERIRDVYNTCREDGVDYLEDSPDAMELVEQIRAEWWEQHESVNPFTGMRVV
jgi:hypothetical protein